MSTDKLDYDSAKEFATDNLNDYKSRLQEIVDEMESDLNDFREEYTNHPDDWTIADFSHFEALKDTIGLLYDATYMIECGISRNRAL